MQRGSIYHLEKYLQGKCLDHSGWTQHLPRKITPSDIDMVLDNNGRILFVELSSKTCVWSHLQTGQKILYRNLVLNGGGKQFAALAQHEVEGRAIESDKDVKKFSLLYLKDGELQESGPHDGKHWVEAVKTILGVE